MILWVPFLTTTLIVCLFMTRPRIAAWLATAAMFLAFLASVSVCLQFFAAGSAHPAVIESALTWIRLGAVHIEFGISLNGLSLIMLLIVTGVGTLIFLYSTAYMEKDASLARYFASLSLFVFSMLGIVLSNNFIQIFIFWELVGLSSYLLIGFWFEKPEASTAGKKAFLTTRVGDVGMMIGILLLYGFLTDKGLGTFNFAKLEEVLPQAGISEGFMCGISLLIFLGVVGKSAQVPLHVWLPDAMEGPTPVSALIHAATMVVAGVFLLARVFFLFHMSETALGVIAWTGGITALLAATVAIVQTDIKKILAYSTLSQLGYMVMALGLGSVSAGMFHLTTHAFFKALLFLGAGSLIHVLHTQNIWEMSTLARTHEDSRRKGCLFLRKMPVTSWTFLLGTLALMGIPPLSGFFSKEAILAQASHGPAPLFVIALVTVFLTAFYMGRLFTIVFLTGHGQETGGAPAPHIHEPDWRILVPLVTLAVLSVVGGYLPLDAFLATGEAHSAGHGPAALAAISLGLAAAGFSSAFYLYRNRGSSLLGLDSAWHGPVSILERKYFFDDFYDLIIRFVQENIARLSDLFERYVVVEIGMNGLAQLTRGTGDLLRRLQTGIIQFYALIFTLGVTVCIYMLILSGAS